MGVAVKYRRRLSIHSFTILLCFFSPFFDLEGSFLPRVVRIAFVLYFLSEFSIDSILVETK